MKKPLSIVVALIAAAALAPEAQAQWALEGAGQIGHTRVDQQAWLGRGAYAPERLNYGGNVGAWLGRRAPGSLQLGLELGAHRLLGYRFVQGTEVREGKVNSYRGALSLRVWFNQATFFGEFGAGVNRLLDRFDPTLVVAIGDLWNVSDHLSIMVKGRANFLFDRAAPVLPLDVSAGVAWRFGS